MNQVNKTRKTAVVTGASRGIGYETAIQLASASFDIAAVSLPDPERMAQLNNAVLSLNRRFKAYELDLGQVESHGPLIDRICDDFDSIECLVNNAGVSVLSRGDLLDVSIDSFDRCFNVNTRGTFFFTQTIAKRMSLATPPEGTNRSIVFITSSNAVAASVTRGEYCMSKTALSMACKLFAIRLAEFGIGVFEIQPGLILTEMTAPSKHKYDALIANGMTVDQRWGYPADVARVVQCMASGFLPYTVAQEIRVDGGLMITRF
jgi:NAD(P)-dependent dehydrogenase (short-subunit alcohol dehydrogenase family)